MFRTTKCFLKLAKIMYDLREIDATKSVTPPLKKRFLCIISWSFTAHDFENPHRTNAFLLASPTFTQIIYALFILRLNMSRKVQIEPFKIRSRPIHTTPIGKTNRTEIYRKIATILIRMICTISRHFVRYPFKFRVKSRNFLKLIFKTLMTRG